MFRLGGCQCRCTVCVECQIRFPLTLWNTLIGIPCPLDREEAFHPEIKDSRRMCQDQLRLEGPEFHFLETYVFCDPYYDVGEVHEGSQYGELSLFQRG